MEVKIVVEYWATGHDKYLDSTTMIMMMCALMSVCALQNVCFDVRFVSAFVYCTVSSFKIFDVHAIACYIAVILLTEKPRLSGLALAFQNLKPGQSHYEAPSTARHGLAYLGPAWPGSRPQAGPCTALIAGQCRSGNRHSHLPVMHAGQSTR
jgi:hypothetical protein